LGHQTGTKFFKKFLLKKSTAKNFTSLPIDLPIKNFYEESELVETFLKLSNGSNGKKILESSIERKGNDRAFTYTQKSTLDIGGQVLSKKRSISAVEYIHLEGLRNDQIPQLKSKRLCTVDGGLYMIIDWYEELPDQPMTCIVQVNSEVLKRSGERIKLPAYVNVERDITD
jgi:hypothetical protein